MATRFLGRVPIRQRASSTPKTGDKSAIGADTLVALANDDDTENNEESIVAADETRTAAEATEAEARTRCRRRRSGKVTMNHTTTAANASDRSLTPSERLDLGFWGLPELVLARYRQRGIGAMFEWQAECLGVGSVLDGGNLVYSAPTSAGKTLVAELLLVKRVLETKKKALLILPFVSLAREKMFGLQALLKDCHVRVHGFMGSQAPPGGMKRADVAVCTIEKANGIVNRMLEEGTLTELGIVVVDELHLLGDPSRGYLLELLLTKIRYMSSKKDSGCNIQIVGMSATLPNLDQLANWLDADLFKTDFRPVPLSENIKIGRQLFNSQLQHVRDIVPPVEMPSDTDSLIYLCLETVLNGHSVLVFCPTKNWCEKVADTVAKDFFNLGRPNPGDTDTKRIEIRKKLQAQLDATRLGEVLEQLRRSPAGLDPTLKKVVAFATSFHHAGLTFDERDIIEGAFKSGALRVLVATSTLSSGVNLPARRVIVRCPFTFQSRLMDTLTYKQMVGRAGRKGVDTEGESILICRENERDKVMEQLVAADLKPVVSCLLQRSPSADSDSGLSVSSALKRAILEVVASGAATTPEQVERYASCTMVAAAASAKDDEEGVFTQPGGSDIIEKCVEFLEKNEFIRLQENCPDEHQSRYMATQLGLACLASSLSPDEGLHVSEELQRARKCFVLENELHMIYQVVPIYSAVSWPNMDWIHYLDLWERLSPDMKRVGELVGVEERFLIRAMRGTISVQTEKQARQMAVHQRFYTALALHDLVNEVSLTHVANKYSASKGMLQSLQQAASTFAGMVTAFCHKMGWLNLELLIGQFQNRLQFGVQRELVDLCRLNALNGQRARTLYNAKIDTVAVLANTSPAEVENVLWSAMPFESRKRGDGETEREAERRAHVRSFWMTGMKGMTIAEAAKVIVDEARELLQKDLGMTIDWSSTQEREKSLVAANESRVVFKEDKPKKSGGRRKKAANSTKTKKRTSPRLNGRKPVPKSGAPQKACKREGSFSNQQNQPTAKKARDHVDREFCSTPNPASRVNGSANLPTPTTPTAAVTAPTNLSFDTSGQMEELFAQEIDDGTETSAKSRRQSGGFDVSCQIEEIFERAAIESSKTCGEISDDMFGDSFAKDLSTIDNMLEQQQASKKAECPAASKRNVAGTQKNQTVNRSCPKTPNLEACSEELRFSHCNSTTEKSRDLDDTLSDSFLERAMDSHMSEEDYMEAEANRPIAPNEKNGGVTPVLKSPDGNFLIPAPKPSLAELKAETPKSAEKTSRLYKRRQTQKRAAASVVSLASKTSPGCLVVSDSDSDCVVESPAQTKASRTPSDELRIYDVCTSRELFQSFAEDLSRAGSFSMAVACDKILVRDEERKSGIGDRFRKKKPPLASKQTEDTNDSNLETLTLTDFSLTVVGIAVCFRDAEVFYIALSGSKNITDPDDTIAPPSQDVELTLKEKSEALARSLSEASRKAVSMFDCKEQLKILYLALGAQPSASHIELRDPKVAAWMLQPSEKERNLANLFMNFDPLSPESLRHSLLDTLGSSTGVGSVAINAAGGDNSARSRAVAEAAIVRRVMGRLESELSKVDMWNTFRDVEMPSVYTLVAMELNGVGFSESESNRQKKILLARMDELETKAYGHAGHQFQMTAPEDIIQVLYRELGLPINGDKSIKRSVLSSANPRQKPSSNKEALIRLKQYHDLPEVILEWRKLNNAITKVVFPMNKAASACDPDIGGRRVYTRCSTQTATGRVSLHEPNIQNIPRDFEVAVTPALLEKALGIEEARQLELSLTAASTASLTANVSTLLSSYIEVEPTHQYTLSMRHAVVAREGFLILAADYSQLELRILAHLSGDEKLSAALDDGKDVFKAIAAEWKRVDVSEVTADMRQEAKQICYGMIYGIGAKSLGEQLGVVEEEAAIFISSFRETYPGVKRYMDSVLTECKLKGYVRTLTGRRRYLPKITSGANQFAKAAAERQAINTTVQGSAADLVKTAMNDIARRLRMEFPNCERPLRPSMMAGQGREHRGAYFILQLHDELIYEVATADALRVSAIVRECMETACRLQVSTPVNLKIGPSWGQLQALKDM